MIRGVCLLWGYWNTLCFCSENLAGAGSRAAAPVSLFSGYYWEEKGIGFLPDFQPEKKRKRFLHHSRLSSITINVNEKHPCNEPCMYMLSCFSRVRLFVTLWTVARQAFLSIGFSRQEYWSGLPCPPSGDLRNPGIKPISLRSLHWQAGSLPPVPPGKPKIWKKTVKHPFHW